MGRGLRVDIQSKEKRYSSNGTRLGPQWCLKDLIKVRRGVRAHQQHAAAETRKGDGRCAGDAGFSNAAFSSKKERTRSAFDEVHAGFLQQQPDLLLEDSAVAFLGPQHPVEAAGATSSFFTTTPASAASVSRDG